MVHAGEQRGQKGHPSGRHSTRMSQPEETSLREKLCESTSSAHFMVPAGEQRGQKRHPSEKSSMSQPALPTLWCLQESSVARRDSPQREALRVYQHCPLHDACRRAGVARRDIPQRKALWVNQLCPLHGACRREAWPKETPLKKLYGDLKRYTSGRRSMSQPALPTS